MPETTPLSREEEKAIDALDRALELMNDSGAHWVQGSYKTSFPVDEEGKHGYCSLGAIHEVTGGWEGAADIKANRARHIAAIALADAYRKPRNRATSVIDAIVTWNDDEDTNWSKVKARFSRAKSRIRKGAL